ncbi:MAG: hypothetical protein E5X34_25405 [Mesorhizobium sp.]|uniref:HIRAN domain-containing protein n=1 Tax=Mesorhizobium sp. TaxID=1871066 RepID=UPI00122A8489|nr:HIRAN domain-containing protein [Mesorhizobium sp.]TIR16671.1 MAG: hypothetical protein E5X34_25405 [Mesorhizobium sp.]
MSNRIFVAWQDDATRKWHTIGRLTKEKDAYYFVFTKGVKYLRTIPFDLFRMDPKFQYRFEELIPLFTNRIPSRSRGDFEKMAHWLNVREMGNEFELLSKFGLIPGTDSILMYPEPAVADGRYELEFFVHAMRHMHKDVLDWSKKLEIGGRLLPLLDVQNPVDPCAVALRGEDDTILVGYIPTFYAEDIKRLLIDKKSCASARIKVVRTNQDAPIQLRLLCRFESVVPSGFQVMQSEVHQPFVEFEKAR